jgi:hypothetical protein
MKPPLLSWSEIKKFIINILRPPEGCRVQGAGCRVQGVGGRVKGWAEGLVLEYEFILLLCIIEDQ